MGDTLECGHLVVPAGDAAGPGVLVLHAWWGLNDFFRQVCDQLAQEGFVAFAPDLYAGNIATTIDEAKKLRSKYGGKKAHAPLAEALDTLVNHPRTTGLTVGVIGFSLGAHYALTLLKDAPAKIGAVVAFYGTAGGTYNPSSAAFLGHFAETDEYVSAGGVKNLRKAFGNAGIDATFYDYPGTQHWFVESNQPQAYQAEAADLAWQRTLDFLHTHLE